MYLSSALLPEKYGNSLVDGDTLKWLEEVRLWDYYSIYFLLSQYVSLNFYVLHGGRRRYEKRLVDFGSSLIVEYQEANIVGVNVLKSQE